MLLVALDRLHHGLQGADRTGGAVDGVHHHQAGAVLGQQPLEVQRIVVAEHMGHGAGGPDTFPQRGMGQRIDVDRAAGIGKALQRPQVRRVAGLADERVFLPGPGRQLALQGAGRLLVAQEHARLHHRLVVLHEGIHLGLHDVGVAGHRQVVVAVEADRLGPGPRALQQRAAAPVPGPAGFEIAGDALLEPVRQLGAGTDGLRGTERGFHGVLLLKQKHPLEKTAAVCPEPPCQI
jgi:hypothetical protein